MFNLSRGDAFNWGGRDERHQLDPGNPSFWLSRPTSFSISPYSSPQACYNPLQDIGLSGDFHSYPESSSISGNFDLSSRPWTSSAFKPPCQPTVPENSLSRIYGQSPPALSARGSFMFPTAFGETKCTLESELKFKNTLVPWDSPFPVRNYNQGIDEWVPSVLDSNLNLEHGFSTPYGRLRFSRNLRLSVEAGALDAAIDSTSIDWDNRSYDSSIHLEKGRLGISKEFSSLRVNIDVLRRHNHGPFEPSDDCSACRVDALLDPNIFSVRGTYDWRNRSKAQTRVEACFVKANWAKGAWVLQTEASHSQNVGPVRVMAGVKKDQDSKQWGFFAKLWKYL